MVVKRKVSTKRNNIGNKLETNSNNNHSNYCEPLTSQVEEPENITQQIKIIDKEKGKRVRWKLQLHINDIKNSKKSGRRVQEKTQKR